MTFYQHINGIHYLSSTGSSIQVQQTPDQICKYPRQSATISCLHMDNNYDRIYWYKQNDKQLFVSLGYMNFKQPFPEADVELSGGASRNQSCTLTIKSLELNSRGVYYCAASSHSAASHSS